MKCLSLKQPWATLMIKGIKDIENRKWKTNHRGPLLIHASGTWDKNGEAYLLRNFREDITRIAGVFCPMASIIGKVEMIDCVTDHSSKWFWGPYGFIFINPIEFLRPIPYQGRLNIFNIPDEIINEI